MQKPQNAQPAATAKGASTRDRIVAAARTKLIEHGVDGFGLRDLAASLDLKLSNVQYYFKTREALLFHVLQQEADADIRVIQKHQQNSDTPEAAFRAIVRDLVVRWRGDSGILFSTLGTLSLHNEAFRKLYRSIYTVFYSALESSVRTMNPALSDDEARIRVRLITALIDGSSMQVRVGSVPRFLDRLQAQAEQVALAPGS